MKFKLWLTLITFLAGWLLGDPVFGAFMAALMYGICSVLGLIPWRQLNADRKIM